MLEIVVGRNKGGAIRKDFSAFPVVLVAGTTGSGKTAFVQNVLIEMMDKFNPEDVKFVIFDSKGMDYTSFNGTSHILLPVITDTQKATSALNWMLAEAKRRFASDEQYTHIITILDDYAAVAGLESTMTELAQVGRQVKMHCWLITSTPSSHIIPTDLRANISTRIAFNSVTRLISRIILDENGAERLTVSGEIVFKDSSGTVRCFAVHKNNDEIEKILSASRVPVKLEEPIVESTKEMDELLYEAAKIMVGKDRASIGMLQRTFKIGFNRAARIMDQLEEIGVVGPPMGDKPRKVLVKSLTMVSRVKEK